MHGVELPEPGDAMERPVLPVGQEVGQQQELDELQREGLPSDRRVAFGEPAQVIDGDA